MQHLIGGTPFEQDIFQVGTNYVPRFIYSLSSAVIFWEILLIDFKKIPHATENDFRFIEDNPREIKSR